VLVLLTGAVWLGVVVIGEAARSAWCQEVREAARYPLAG
jgi:hypothetical protein